MGVERRSVIRFIVNMVTMSQVHHIGYKQLKGHEKEVYKHYLECDDKCSCFV